MKKAQPVLALLVIFTIQSFCCGSQAQVQPTPVPPVAVTPGNTTSGATATPVTQNQSVGTINLVNSQVQAGPPNNLQSLNGVQDFYNGYGVLVTQGGKGKLALNDGTEMTLFNETGVSGVTVNTSPPESDLFLQSQGLIGHVPPGGHTTVTLPNGASVTILGTHFLILFNTNSQVATAGNFDGTVMFTPPNGTQQQLPAGKMVDIDAGGNITLLDLPFTPQQFEDIVGRGTPVDAMIRLRRKYKLAANPGEPPAQLSHWSNWEYLGGTFKDAPAVASRAGNRLDVFARGGDDILIHKWWDGSTWSGWENLGSQLASSPAAVSWSENRIDVVGLGVENNVQQYWWDGNQWNGWYSLQWIKGPDGGNITNNAPAISSWQENRLDVFVGDTNGMLWHKWWDGSGWSDWEGLAGFITSAPAAVSWDVNRIDIVARGPDGQVVRYWWNGQWNGWYDLGGKIQDAPAIASWGPNHLDVFARSQKNTLLHKSWDGSNWSDWEDLGGAIYSSPTAVSWGPGRIDVFARGEKDDLVHIWYQQ